MKKTIIVTIIADEVQVSDLSSLLEEVEKIFEEYQYKRVDVSLSDISMVKPQNSP